MTIAKLGVVGAGQMGAGIAQVAAMAGIETHVVDVSADSLARGQKVVADSLGRLQKKGVIDETKATLVQKQLKWSTAMADLRDANFVVEAVPESEALKSKILAELNGLLKPDAILASNTSSISITR